MKENRVKSVFNIYKFSKTRKIEEEEKIRQANKLLKEKILAQKKKTLSIKELKKQFKEHDRNVEHLRKIKWKKKL